MKKTIILICDDSIAVHEGLKTYLNAEGMNVVSVFDGESVLEKLRSSSIDLVILDIMLPGMSGTDVCRAIRKVSDVPILMLSARSEELDKIVGLELGADDYVTKPFSAREVTARVQVVLRRLNSLQKQEKLCFAELCIYPESYEAYVEDIKIDLTPKEILVLSHFVRNAGKVLSREQILGAICGVSYYGDTRTVDMQVKRLRQKLPGGKHFAIQSVYGIGYKLEEVK